MIAVAAGLSLSTGYALAAQSLPKGMFEVKPATRPVPPAAGANLQLANGQFFTYALPQGWHVGEDGQFALTLLAPDNKALTVMVGNAGVSINTPPAQYVAAFGMRGVMQQNLQNSTAYAQAAKEYRDWSQKNWQGVTDQRNASSDRNNTEFREALGNVQSYDNPHDSRTPVELPNTYQYYWVNEQGTYVGTNDPSVDPNSGSTHDWRRMPKHRP